MRVRDDVDTEWLDGLIGYQLRCATRAMSTDYAWHAGPDRLRPVQVHLIGMIADNPGISAAALGSLLGVVRANMVTLVGDLVERGLVERRASDGDRRVVELHLTPAGDEAAALGRKVIGEHEERMTARLSAADRRRLLDLLRRLVARSAETTPP